jgi:hypothetical protein
MPNNSDDNHIVYDYEHHHDHLVNHPGDHNYLYDPIHHFLIIKPAGHDDKLDRPGVFDDEYHELLERAANEYNVDQYDDHIQHYDHDSS